MFVNFVLRLYQNVASNPLRQHIMHHNNTLPCLISVLVWELRWLSAYHLNQCLLTPYCVLINELHLFSFRSRRQVLGVTAVTPALTEGKTAAPRDEQRLRVVASAVFGSKVAASSTRRLPVSPTPASEQRREGPTVVPTGALSRLSGYVASALIMRLLVALTNASAAQGGAEGEREKRGREREARIGRETKRRKGR